MMTMCTLSVKKERERRDREIWSAICTRGVERVKKKMGKEEEEEKEKDTV